MYCINNSAKPREDIKHDSIISIENKNKDTNLIIRPTSKIKFRKYTKAKNIDFAQLTNSNIQNSRLSKSPYEGISVEKRKSKHFSENSYSNKYKQTAASDCKLPCRSKLFNADITLPSDSKSKKIRNTKNNKIIINPYGENSRISNITNSRIVPGSHTVHHRSTLKGMPDDNLLQDVQRFIKSRSFK